jgi:hypothetical protein
MSERLTPEEEVLVNSLRSVVGGSMTVLGRDGMAGLLRIIERLSGGGSPPTDKALEQLMDVLGKVAPLLGRELSNELGEAVNSYGVAMQVRGRAEPGEGSTQPTGCERLTDALEALAGWMVLAAINGAYVSNDLLEWGNETLRGKTRTPVEVTRAALRVPDAQTGEAATVSAKSMTSDTVNTSAPAASTKRETGQRGGPQTGGETQ